MIGGFLGGGNEEEGFAEIFEAADFVEEIFEGGLVFDVIAFGQEGGLDSRFQNCHGGAELVGRVCGELFLALEGDFEAFEQGVHGASHWGEVGGQGVVGESQVQSGLLDLIGFPSQFANGGETTPGNNSGQRDGNQQ